MRTNQEMFDDLGKYIESLDCNPDNLIAVLHYAQGLFGYLPEVVQEFVAKKLNISAAQVYGVVTFYSFFSMKPKGQYVINVCMGTACFVRGANKILEKFENVLNIKNGETTPDGRYTLTTLRCVGACGLAPVVQVNGKTFGNCTEDTVDVILEEFK